MRRIVRAGLVLVAAGSACTAGCQRRHQEVVAPPPRSVTLTPGADGVQDVTVSEAGPGLFRFVPDTVTAGVGRIRLTFRNVGNTPHNLTFDELSEAGRRVAVPTIRGGGEETVDFTVGSPGRYRFVCSIHEALGQTGTLIVRR